MMPPPSWWTVGTPRDASSRGAGKRRSGYTAATDMVTCPLCGRRVARRECPAKGTRICSVCCGTKREVEIDCTPDCIHLASGRAWEAGRTELRLPSQQFSRQFLHRTGPAINALAAAIVTERAVWPTMHDADVRAVLEALRSTLRTLAAGLYYETIPEGSPIRASVYRRVKSIIDGLLKPASVDAPKLSEVQMVVEFLISTYEMHSSERSKSRRYLDWLSRVVPPEPPEQETDRLILP